MYSEDIHEEKVRQFLEQRIERLETLIERVLGGNINPNNYADHKEMRGAMLD